MTSNRTRILAALASLLMVGTAIADAAPPIPVGQDAPNFALKDQAGSEISLADLVKKKPVALIFYRSADW